MRTASAHSSKRNLPPAQKVPRPGTKLRELWDLLHVYRGEVLEQPLTSRFPGGCLEQLRNFYGCDIRQIGTVSVDGGPGEKSGRYVLAGEWFGQHYVDYIAERIAKADAKRAKP